MRFLFFLAAVSDFDSIVSSDRKAIIKSAIRLLEEHPEKVLTRQCLATESGLSANVVSLHFKSQSDLMLEIARLAVL